MVVQNQMIEFGKRFMCDPIVQLRLSLKQASFYYRYQFWCAVDEYNCSENQRAMGPTGKRILCQIQRQDYLRRPMCDECTISFSPRYFITKAIAKVIQVDFRQSFGGSISIADQCIEAQLMAYDSSGQDLEIIAGHFYVRLLLHGVICITKSQHLSNCFYHIIFLYSSLGHFSPTIGTQEPKNWHRFQ